MVRVELCPDLLTRFQLALHRVEEDTCWATARNHPKFPRIYAIADFAILALEYAARALEMTNAGALNEKERRKLDRAVNQVEKIVKVLEQSGQFEKLLHVLKAGRSRGGQKTAKKLQRKSAKNSTKVVARWNQMEKRGYPERRNRASRIAEETDIPVRNVRRYLNSAGLGR